MSTGWHLRDVPIKLQLGEKIFAAPTVRLRERQVGLGESLSPVQVPLPPAEPLPSGCEGWMIRSLPVSVKQPALRRRAGFICYVPSQYPRHYIDLGLGFAAYKQSFSSKTRSTITRKVRRYAEHCGGDIVWKVYETPEEMVEFFRLARIVSAKTYQEKLLDAGLPDNEDFLRDMQALACDGRVRAFILFDSERPVSYLYCPVYTGAFVYQYLGYDPDYMAYSVGTVLQWLALERLFAEARFRYFDFTEGQSEHKRLFATGSVQCANVLFLRDTLRNRFLVYGQYGVDRVSAKIGDVLDRFGLRGKIRKLLRFGR